MSLDTDAKALWDAMQTTKPSWDQLGEVTKGVWRERVLAGLTPARYRGPFPVSGKSDPQEQGQNETLERVGRVETAGSAPPAPQIESPDPIEVADSPRYFAQPQLF